MLTGMENAETPMMPIWNLDTFQVETMPDLRWRFDELPEAVAWREAEAVRFDDELTVMGRI